MPLDKLTKNFTQPHVELRFVYEAGRDYGGNRVIQSRDREGALNIGRALERECHRNVELIWLRRTRKPDFKTNPRASAN